MTNIPTFVCIDQEEFEMFKIFQEGLNLSTLDKNTLENINKEIEQEINRKLEKIDKRQIEQQVFLYTLNGEIKKNEIETQRRIKEQDKKIVALRQEYLEIFKYEKEKYIKLFFDHSKNLMSIVENIKLNNSLDLSGFSVNDKKKERVLVLIKDLKLLSNSLESLPHSQFFPNKFEYAKSLFQEIKEDFQAEFYESAFMNARNCYKILTELREQTLIKEKEYIYLEAVLNKNIKYIEFLINKPLKINKIKINIESDEINKIKRWIKNIKKSFNDNHNFTIEGFKDFVAKSEEYIKIYESESEKLFKLSISSQIRSNIAQYLNDTFILFFYKLVDSGYINNDFRKSFFLLMENNLSEKLLIYIDPDKKNLFNYKIRLESDNKDIDIKLIQNLLKNLRLVQDSVFDNL